MELVSVLPKMYQCECYLSYKRQNFDSNAKFGARKKSIYLQLFCLFQGLRFRAAIESKIFPLKMKP